MRNLIIFKTQIYKIIKNRLNIILYLSNINTSHKIKNRNNINIISPGIPNKPTIKIVKILIGIYKSITTAIKLKTYKIKGARKKGLTILIKFFKANTSKNFMIKKLI